jgi:hypothetical protein
MPERRDDTTPLYTKGVIRMYPYPITRGRTGRLYKSPVTFTALSFGFLIGAALLDAYASCIIEVMAIISCWKYDGSNR